MSKKKILYLSTYHFANVGAFSGTNRRIYDALSLIGDYSVDFYLAKPNPVIKFLVRAVGWVVRTFFGKCYQTGLLERYSPSVCRRTIAYLRRHSYDCIICWQLCFGPVFKLFPGKKIFFADSTYHAIVPYYQWKVSPQQFQRVDRLQKSLLSNCDQFWCFSSYFVRDAVDYYYVAHDKIWPFRFFPSVFGRGRKSRFTHSEINILFIGTNYRDKGTRIAIEAVRLLNFEHGLSAHLIVVGVQNEEGISIPEVTFLGKVSQFIETDRFRQLYEDADIFLLPTHHECAGIVFTEAASFGVPCVSYKTGGVPDYVCDGYSGYLLPPGSPPADFAKLIHERLCTPEQRDIIGRNAYEFYKRKLSKDVFMENAQKALDSLFGEE